MINSLLNFFRSTKVRSFDGASTSRRFGAARTMENFGRSVLASAAPLRRRGRYYTANNPWAANAINSLVANIVGTGIKPQSQHPVPAVREVLNSLWEDWTDEADADGLQDFYGLQALAVRSMIDGGEAFGRMEVDRDRSVVPLRLRLMDPEQLDIAMYREADQGSRIVGGVELDQIGRRLAYHFMRRPLSDPQANSLDLVRVPAEDVAHLFVPNAIGQVRGVSWLAPVFLRLHEVDQMEDAHLVRQKVAALFAGFITSMEGAGSTFDGTQYSSVLEAGMEPGTLKFLPQGTDIRFSDPAQVGDAMEVLKLALRGVAAGMGITYEQLTGDLSGVNYSSIRAGLVETRRRLEALQHHVVVYQFCRPIWRRFVTLAVLSGALRADDFEARRADYFRVSWSPQGFEWVDPQKDVRAETEAIAAGLSSRRQAVARRGFDIEQLDAEIAADARRAESLGLAFEGPTAAAAPAEQGGTDADGH